MSPSRPRPLLSVVRLLRPLSPLCLQVRAMQIIDELEANKRGPYGGGIGHVSFTGARCACSACSACFVRSACSARYGAAMQSRAAQEAPDIRPWRSGCTLHLGLALWAGPRAGRVGMEASWPLATQAPTYPPHTAAPTGPSFVGRAQSGAAPAKTSPRPQAPAPAPKLAPNRSLTLPQP